MMSKELSNVQNQMFQVTSSSSSPGKGDSPTSISKMSTPRPHQSTALVQEVSVSTFEGQSQNLLTIKDFTSGAKNSGVPQKVPVLSPYPIPSLHKPKSAILTQPSVSSSKLSSLRSLRRMSDEVKYAEHEGFGACSIFRPDRFRTRRIWGRGVKVCDAAKTNHGNQLADGSRHGDIDQSGFDSKLTCR